ncbi:MAG: hypothetical protein GTN76_03965 [Candidatus Aenigmarchaeota archaeon]|nr:hypothetical protein [Candidatus Aenigmarchaeota archaeon]
MKNYKQLVRVPEDPFYAMHILDKELIPNLRLNPESWDLVGAYMDAMRKKFGSKRLRILEFCKEVGIQL